MQIGKEYLASITSGDEFKSCVFEISRTPRVAGSVALQTIISVDGGCVDRARQEPGYGQRVLLFWDGRVPILGAAYSVGERAVVAVDPPTAVQYYNLFTHMHSESAVMIPHRLPDDLTHAFDAARVYVPGPQDAPVGLYL